MLGVESLFIATVLNSVSLPRSWLPIFVIALKSAPVYAQRYTPTDLQWMAPSDVTAHAQTTRAQMHRAQMPGAEWGPNLFPEQPR